MSRPDPSALRWLIGAELKGARNRAGLSITQLSNATGIVRGKLGNMESGKYTQYPADIAKFLEVCNAKQSDIDRLSSLAGKTDEKSWWAPYAAVLPDWNRTYVGLEGMASQIFSYEPVVLPGLLQTAEYAETLTEAVGFVRADHAERFVEFRRARAERLTSDEQPLHLHAVIEEGALRRIIGDSDVMARQYEHLLEMAELDNVTIQIACPSGLPHPASGQFAVLDFDIAQSIAFIEQIDGAVYAQDRDAVNAYKMVAETLERVALNPAKSQELITRADTWK